MVSSNSAVLAHSRAAVDLSRASLVAGYRPTDTLPNLTDYYLSTLGIGDSSGEVDSWESQILGHVIAAVDVARPTLITGANDIQGVEFDGVDDVLRKDSGFDIVGAAETDLYVSAVIAIQTVTSLDVGLEISAASADQFQINADSDEVIIVAEGEGLGGIKAATTWSAGAVLTIEGWTTGGLYRVQFNGDTEVNATWTAAAYAASDALIVGNRNNTDRAAAFDYYEINFQVGTIPSSSERSDYRTETYAYYGHSGA